jgi:hypothetical protein
LCGKRADLTSRVYLSYSSAPEVGLGGSSNSVEGTTVTENTSHRGTRTDISTLRLEAFIRQEIHKQNTEQTEIIMKRIKSLIDPLINQVARLSKKYHSASLNDQFSNLSTRVNDYQRSDSTTHNDTQQPSQRGVGWIVRSTTNEETDIHSRVQSEDIRDSRTLNSRGSRGPVRGRN